ncbi:MAG: pyridoxamine 5'-phosphate oxidase family protein [Candidatus Fermentibacteraceae bacterium]|nr:pyridoxamine 5'-phosphate oxidase family protein [Candidatus Fermentibacteraceae bacterium]MBN2609490.1 pyridoxamine 5'-phosphate oxidase family protein [Candidatus Fermentibacteraceae bacterium]
MRRNDREITDPALMEDILRRGLVCRLGVIRGDDPYIVPMSFGYEDGCLYFHSAMEGLKVDCIRNRDRVCFEVECDVTVTESDEACDWTMGYGSVVGYGTISEVSGNREKLKALNILMRHYSGRKGWSVPPGQLDRTLVLKLDIVEITGKRSAG